MIEILFRIRYLAIVVAIFMLLNSIAMMVLGAIKAIEGYLMIFEKFQGTEHLQPGISLAESVDALLFALVTMIFFLGIIKLFISNNQVEVNLPEWLNIKDFKQLKTMLWEALLVALVLTFTIDILRHDYIMDWKTLILPASIILLSGSLKLMAD